MACSRARRRALAAITIFAASTALGVLCAQQARAQDPSPLGASVLYESPTLVVPLLFLVLPGKDGSALQLRQTGWNSGLDWLVPSTPELSYVLSADLTPIRAHSSNLVYRDGQRDASAEWSDSYALVSGGVRVKHSTTLSSELRVLAMKDWVSSLHDVEQSRVWQAPYLGSQLQLSYVNVRSDEPLRTRWDGLKLVLNAQLFAGELPWGRGRALLGAGRKLGRVFVHANAVGSYVSLHNRVSDELYGGSWDALQGFALYGHPYAELRLQHAVAGHVGLDLAIVGSWELGLRCAALASGQRRASGQALVTSLSVAGVLLSAGVATPDGEALRGKTESLVVFASATAITLLP